MHQIKENDCLGAWKSATSYLLSNGGDIFNLMIQIDDPCHFDPAWMKDYSPKNIALSGGSRGDDIRDVVHTIFPMKYAQSIKDKDEIYARYLQTHLRGGRLGSRKNGRWGTYFLRLICFAPNAAIKKAIDPRASLNDVSKQRKDFFGDNNQIDRVINALGNWQNSPKAAIYCHISGAHLDSMQPLGSPCLQYIQFTQPSAKKVDMTVVYRSHDYFNKALGNFIGLGQLLKFVCDASGKNPGTLTCHAIRAYHESSQKHLKQLLGV
ncbi:MAG: hypothetical protein KA155_01515 [Alphaproteobacteria bacterium]|nr:hypothetical protein [Alphaproteobacteria bacterium]